MTIFVASQTALSLVTLCSWVYWRLWVFVGVVLVAVATDSKSLWNKSACAVGRCSWGEVPERGPFLLCLSLLLVLHVTRLRTLGARVCREDLTAKGAN